MSSHNKDKLWSKNSRLVKLGLYIGIGLILFLFESLIPRPLPWLKPGLAHIATLITLYSIGGRETFIVVIGRVVLGSLLLGSLFNPTFILSIAGGFMAALVMVILKKYFSSIFSIFGISVSGAVVHNMTQLFIIELLIVQNVQIFYLVPFMMLSAIFTGFIIAYLSQLILLKIPVIKTV